MNTVIIRIGDNQMSALRKFAKQADAKLRVIKDEEDIMAELLEEGLRSDTVTKDAVRKSFLEHGVDL